MRRWVAFCMLWTEISIDRILVSATEPDPRVIHDTVDDDCSDGIPAVRVDDSITLNLRRQVPGADR